MEREIRRGPRIGAEHERAALARTVHASGVLLRNSGHVQMRSSGPRTGSIRATQRASRNAAWCRDTGTIDVADADR